MFTKRYFTIRYLKKRAYIKYSPNVLPMVNFTASTDGKSIELANQKPKNSTLELIKQYARVCTPITSIAFSQLIAN